MANISFHHFKGLYRFNDAVGEYLFLNYIYI